MKPLDVNAISVAAANEGIPIAAIARILTVPYSDVLELLQDAQMLGRIVDLPKSDWPPGVRQADRIPRLADRTENDIAFLCAKAFRLTVLEAAFLVTLLKHKHVDKARLHLVVENQRNSRMYAPSQMEATDPKMVDVMICKLRKKLKAVRNGLHIDTVWGSGYFITPEQKDAIMELIDDTPQQKAA
jgi:hypothetical protein